MYRTPRSGATARLIGWRLPAEILPKEDRVDRFTIRESACLLASLLFSTPVGAAARMPLRPRTDKTRNCVDCRIASWVGWG